jgi:hypothetical protein
MGLAQSAINVPFTAQAAAYNPHIMLASATADLATARLRALPNIYRHPIRLSRLHTGATQP